MLTKLLSSVLARPVLNQSNRTEKFNFKLEWSEESVGPGKGGDPTASEPQDAGGASIFTAIQEQLGWKLESTKAPVEVIVTTSRSVNGATGPSIPAAMP